MIAEASENLKGGGFFFSAYHDFGDLI